MPPVLPAPGASQDSPALSQAANSLRGLLTRSVRGINANDELKPRAISSGRSTSLLRRDVVPGIIPTYYRVDGPPTGTIVGIVLGSVAAFLFIIWLLYTVCNLEGQTSGGTIAAEEEIVVRKPRHSPRSSRRSRRSRTTEVREVSRSPRQSQRIVVETRRTSRDRRPRSIIVDERIETRVPGDDIVEVIEEHSDFSSQPPRRKPSRRHDDYRY